jgi:predicted cupin superfamily sugar epimerase
MSNAPNMSSTEPAWEDWNAPPPPVQKKVSKVNGRLLKKPGPRPKPLSEYKPKREAKRPEPSYSKVRKIDCIMMRLHDRYPVYDWTGQRITRYREPTFLEIGNRFGTSSGNVSRWFAQWEDLVSKEDAKMNMNSDLHRVFTPQPPEVREPPPIQTLIGDLKMTRHIEGGYFAETDRSPYTVPCPWPVTSTPTTDLVPQRPGFDPAVRNASTSIFYLLTPNSPQGGFHRNKGRTIHTLHRGRGRYVIIHPDEPEIPGVGKKMESFVVGQDITKGERLQWIVEGGKYKASYLLEDVDGMGESTGLLISETVVPGFEYCDHDFLTEVGLERLLGEERKKTLEWLLRPGEKKDIVEEVATGASAAAEDAVGGDAVSGDPPGGNTVAADSVEGGTPGDNTAAGDTLGKTTPSGDNVGGDTAVGDVVGDRMAGHSLEGDTAGGDIAGEHTPGGNTVRGDTVGEDTAEVDTLGKHISGDDSLRGDSLLGDNFAGDAPGDLLDMSMDGESFSERLDLPW